MTGPQDSFEVLLRDGAIALLALTAVWGAVVGAAVLVEAASAGRFRAAARLGCPPGWHRWLLTVATAVLAALLVAPSATAEERRLPAARMLDGLALPDRAPGGTASETPQQNLRAREPPSVSGWVTVQPGDSLWRISRRLLPADASAGSIAELTRTLYALNRTTLGADPDLIRPGQRLHVPPAAHETYSEDS